MSVVLTEKAAKEVQRVAQDQNFDDETMLRVAINGGGCSGFQYGLRFDKEYDEAKDDLMIQHGVKVVVDKKSNLYLDGTNIDFYDGLERRGFVFNNPHAVKTCGCGHSFSPF